MKRIFILCFAGIFLWIGCKSVDTTSSASSKTWNGSMRNLQSNLAEIEPYLFDSEKFANPYNLVGEKIHKMAIESKDINHDPTLTHRDPTVRFVASHFSTDLERADQSFTEGKTEYARYELMKITSNCVQCHTRMQQGPEINFARTEPFLKSMPVVDQAEYLIASRKFQKAFDVLINALGVERIEPPQSLRLERIADLALMVAVQFEQSPNMVTQLADKIDQNQSLPFYLKAKSKEWRANVAQWKAEKPSDNKIALAEKLVNSKSEINSMRAIPQLLSLLNNDQPKEQLGKTLFLTGVAYESLVDVSSMELHENYYEACIRQVPHSVIAKKCFHNLENSILMGYTGTSGTHLPITTHLWLENLKNESE